MRARSFVLALASLALLIAPAQADDLPSTPEDTSDESRVDGLVPGGPGDEPIDRTRLDVERLPLEPARARELTRDLYDRGWFVEAQLGGLTFAGDARELSRPGPRFAIAFGYELTRWLAVLIEAEASMHATHNRPPPRRTSYELLGGAAGVRLTVPIDARFALFGQGLFGLVWSSADVLRTLGLPDAGRLGLGYGGELGFDWHMPARHHSLGLLGGARMLPSLARDGGYTVGAYGACTLHYVF